MNTSTVKPLTPPSRGRHRNQLYTVEPEPDYETHVIDTDIVHDAIRRAFAHSECKSLAREWHTPGRSAEQTQDVGMEL